nr:hypothetical protein KitaXyl93_07830 [Kitasatospora sp. Xyl93]
MTWANRAHRLVWRSSLYFPSTIHILPHAPERGAHRDHFCDELQRRRVSARWRDLSYRIGTSAPTLRVMTPKRRIVAAATSLTTTSPEGKPLKPDGRDQGLPRD